MPKLGKSVPGTSTQFSANTSTNILRRDKYTCIYCGGLANEIDLVVPARLGGRAIASNGVSCCHSCNTKKAHNLNMQWIYDGVTYLTKQGEDISWFDSWREQHIIYH